MSYSTKQVADMLGIAPQTLRFYERYGIGTESQIEKGGARRYSHACVDELMSIRKYRNCGFTLANAAKVIKSDNQNEVADMFICQCEELEKEIAYKNLVVRKLKEVAEELRLDGSGPEHIHMPAVIGCRVLDQKRQKSESGIQLLSQWSQWMPMAQWTLFISPDFSECFYGFSIEEESAGICGIEKEACFRLPEQRCARMPVSWLAQKDELFDIVLPKLNALKDEFGAAEGQIRVHTLLNRRIGKNIISYGLIFYPIA